MKVCILMGSPRKQGNTNALLGPFRQELEGLGAETETVWLHALEIRPCTACRACQRDWTAFGCAQRDDVPMIFDKVLACDLIVLATPIYSWYCTPPMKALLDHYGYRWMVHRPQEGMFFKQAVCLSTAAGAGTRRTNQDLADSAFFWGIAKIHRYGRNVRAVSWEQVSQARKDRMARELSTLAKRVERGVGKVRPGLRTKAFFTLIRWMQKRGWNEADQVYWREKGWTGRARPWRKA